MAMNINDFPPEIRDQILAKMEAENRGAIEKKKKGSKYHNKKTESSGMKFDSKKEAGRYEDLMVLLAAGEISDLRLQVNFTLQEAYTTPEGERIRAIVYKADFVYKDKDGKMVVEDTKSKATATPVYKMKKKMMKEKLNIDIIEV